MTATDLSCLTEVKKYFICLHVIFFWLSSERISAKLPAGYTITPVGGDKWFFFIQFIQLTHSKYWFMQEQKQNKTNHDGPLSHWIIHITDLFQYTGSFCYKTSDLWVSHWIIHSTNSAA